MKHITFAKAGVAVLALSFMVIMASCDDGSTDTDGGGGGGGGGSVPAELIGNWEGTGTGIAGKYIEFTSEKKLLIRMAADAAPISTYTVTSVSGGKVSVQSANANTSDGSFKYTLNEAKTEMTVSDKSGNGNSVGYSTYTKLAASQVSADVADSISFGVVNYEESTGNCSAAFTRTGTGSLTAKLRFANDDNKATGNPMGWSWNGNTSEDMTIAGGTATFTGTVTSIAKYSANAYVYVVISVGSSMNKKNYWQQIKPAT